MQANRGSFVATPTSELSKQEESLLSDMLDWSLDTSCSGYEGDHEDYSEEEKDGDCKCQERETKTKCVHLSDYQQSLQGGLFRIDKSNE